jgi:hypothetical protein
MVVQDLSNLILEKSLKGTTSFTYYLHFGFLILMFCSFHSKSPLPSDLSRLTRLLLTCLLISIVLMTRKYSIKSFPNPAWRYSARPYCLRCRTKSYPVMPAHSERRGLHVWISGRMFVDGAMDCSQHALRKNRVRIH